MYIEGAFRSRKWTDQDGTERKSFEIVASQIRMLSSNGNGAKAKAENAKLAPETKTSERAAEASEADNSSEADDTDVPF